MENITLNVEGMSCGHCVSAIENNVGELNGVDSVKVSLEDGKVDIAYDISKVELTEIKDVIEDQGYDIA
ncbi:copper chaperone CopZ [Corticicoccus populi]|uniref:Copper chaperone CopZ n=1 Tax=Corticicoccus populi TaxID=1812821 RepID=A0ABW5WYF2_9STAP